jgi:hypothetical protein
VSTIEELLERKSSGSGLDIRPSHCSGVLSVASKRSGLGSSGTRAGFLRVLGLSLPAFHRLLHTHPGLVQWPNSGQSTEWTQSRPIFLVRQISQMFAIVATFQSQNISTVF